MKVYDNWLDAIREIMTTDVKHVVRDTEKREDVLAQFTPHIMVTWGVAWELEQDGYIRNYDGDWFEVVD